MSLDTAGDSEHRSPPSEPDALAPFRRTETVARIAARGPAIVAALVAFVVCGASSRWFQNTPYNNYSLFANALIHGRLWIDWPGDYIDAVLWNGHRYIVNDPLPGVILAPFAVFAADRTNQTLLGCVFAAFGTYFAFRLPQRLGATMPTATWLAAFYLAGTDLLWSSSLGDVWFVAQVCAMSLLTAAVYEALTRKRPAVTAILFGLATMSRFTLVLSGVALAALVVDIPNRTAAARWAAARGFVVPLIPFAALWMAYNQARWGVPYDRGHTIFFHEDTAAGGLDGSPFSLHNLPYQLHSFFVQSPELSSRFPYVIPSLGGVALTFTSPALAIAAFARRPSRHVVWLWLATFLAAGPSLLYYVNGYAQFGMRHAMDFEPYVFALVAIAIGRRVNVVCGILFSWSIAAGIFGTWYWHAFIRV